MIIARKNLGLLSLIVIFSLLFAPIIQAAELSLFQKLKLKTQAKVDQLQQKDWWITQAAKKVVGFAAGKAGGAIGAGVGYLLGAAVGGPLAAGVGAMIGFRIGDIVTNIFAKAVTEVVTQRKLKEQTPVTVRSVVDALKSVNKASLTAESIGTVLGDLIGGSMGAAAGIAFLAGTGPIAIPIIGTLSAAYLGAKLGKAVFGGIGRWIGKKTLVKGYEAFAAEDPEDKVGTVEINESGNNVTEDAKAGVGDINVKAAGSEDARLAYEKAYREYTAAITSGASESEKQLKLNAYAEALQRYKETTNKNVAGNK